MSTFASLDEVASYLETAPNPWCAVTTAGGDLYLLFSAEDSDAFQGIPFETEDGKTDDNCGDMGEFPGTFPLILLTATAKEDAR